MDLTTTKAVPLEDLLVFMATIVTREGYTHDDCGSCEDFGGQAEGFSLATDDGFVLNLYHDDGCFGEEGWQVEEFETATLSPDVRPCVNLAAALATFAHFMRKHPKLPPVHSMTVEEQEAELATLTLAGTRGPRWTALRDSLTRMGVDL